MKKYFLLGSLLTLPMLGFGVTLLDPAADVIESNLHAAEQRKQSIAQDDAPDGVKMIHVKWDAAAARYMEFALRKPVTLPVFKRGTLQVEVFAPENVAVSRFNFRVADSTGETLQYLLTQKLKPGRQVVEFELTDVNKASWGGNKDGRIDFPARFTGMSIDFSAKEGTGELWIGKISFEPAPLDAGELQADLAGVKFVIGQGEARKQSGEVVEAEGRKGLKMSWNSADGPWLEFSFPGAPPLDAFESARFDLELLVPANFRGRRVNMRLNDANGETFQFAFDTDSAAPGWQIVSLTVNKSGTPNRGIWGGDKNQQLDFPVRVSGFSVDYPKESGAGELVFGKVFVVRQ